MAALCLLPITVLMGATLPVLVSRAAVRPRAVGSQTARLAGVNAAGGALGALTAVFVLLPHAGTARTLVVAALVSAVAGITALVLSGRPLDLRARTANVRTENVVQAPHGHLVEKGHEKVLWGRRVGGRVVGKAFIAPSIDTTKSQQHSSFENGLRTEVKAMGG